jgi:hypothetical protein
MREFLHSWNRQAGCVTLVMALAVTGTWVRSLCCYDHVDFAIGDRQHIIYSLNGAISWWSWDLTGDRATRRTNGWGSMFIPEGGGFSGTTLTPKQFRPASVSLDYWTIAIPLTIASALLLLSNPGPLLKWCYSFPRHRSSHQQCRVTVASPAQVSRTALQMNARL